MPRKVQAYTQEILEAITQIRSFVQGLSYETYAVDNKTKSAVERKLMNIGEAMNQASLIQPGLESKIRDFPKIIGLRNVLAHAYFGVDDALVWNVISEKLDQLEQDIKNI